MVRAERLGKLLESVTYPYNVRIKVSIIEVWRLKMTLKDNYASFVESIKTLDYREIIEKGNTLFNINIE